MILTRLYLKNFKKYTNYNIEFSEGLVGIIGKNGSGKSTIFEAILFGLYGETKKRGYKELIRNANASSKDAVVVTLEFEFENLEYKIVREFRGKAMSANAKFYKNNELTITGSKEVTTSVINLTKMSKDAFIHTLFASQKELTSLSTLKNEERKKMIRKLLGLEKIDFIEKELIEKSRELSREIKAFAEVLLSNLDVKEKQEQIKSNVEKKNTLKKDEQNKTQKLIALKDKEEFIKKELLIFSQTKEQKQKVFSNLELLKNSKNIELLNQAKLIAENHKLKHKQEELATLNNVKKEYINLLEDLKKQENLKEYHLKQEGLTKEQIQLREQYTKSKTDIYTLEKACEMFEQYILDVKNLEQDLSISQDAIEVKHTIEQKLLLEMSAEQRVLDEINTKITNIKKLGKDSSCPTCTRPLLEEYDNVINSLKSIVQDTHQKKINEHNIQLENIQIQKAALLKQIKIKDKEYLELTKKISIIKSKQSDLSHVKEHFILIKQKCLKNKKELKALQQYNYNKNLHNKVQKKYDVLTPKYQYVLSLETELKRVTSVKKE